MSLICRATDDLSPLSVFPLSLSEKCDSALVTVIASQYPFSMTQHRPKKGTLFCCHLNQLWTWKKNCCWPPLTEIGVWLKNCPASTDDWIWCSFSRGIQWWRFQSHNYSRFWVIISFWVVNYSLYLVNKRHFWPIFTDDFFQNQSQDPKVVVKSSLHLEYKLLLKSSYCLAFSLKKFKAKKNRRFCFQLHTCFGKKILFL